MYRYDNTVTAPTTSTRFLLYALLIFIREHMKTTSNTLQQLVNDEIILDILRNTAALSYEMYTDGKVVFYENDLKEKGFLNLDLEMTGFIVKRQSERYGQIFYFRYMVLLELFTAIHIFLHPDTHTPDQLIKHYSSCMTNISGLEGILEHSKRSTQLQNDVAKIFVSNISKYLPGKRPINVIPYFLKLLLGKSKISRFSDDYHTWNLFLTCLFESGICLPESSKDKFNGLSINVDLFHHELLYLLNFLDQLEYEHIDSFIITMKNKLFTRHEFERLSRHLSHSVDVRIHYCKIPTNGVSNFSSNVSKCDSYFKRLQFYNCDLSDNDVIKLLPCITHIKTLHLPVNFDITGVALSAISNIIKSTIETNQESKLEEIDVSGCKLTDNDVIKLLPCITHIKKICLSYNRDITGVAMSAISNVIKSTIETNQELKLEEIDVSGCNLTDNDVIKLLPCITHIKKLCLSFNFDITGVAMSPISNFIKSTIEANQESKLGEIDVSFCKLTDNDVIELLPCIAHINKLCLSFNRDITGVATSAISNVIKRTIEANQESKLGEIDVSFCKLTDNDVIELLACVTHVKIFNDDKTSATMIAFNVIKSTIQENKESELEITDNEVIGYSHYLKKYLDYS